jgi:hypothetical protein
MDDQKTRKENRAPLDTDGEGNVILKPVTGWTLASVGELAVLLQVQYEDGPEDIGTTGKRIQFVLTPPKCLELAEILTKHAKRLLEKLPPGKTRH